MLGPQVHQLFPELAFVTPLHRKCPTPARPLAAFWAIAFDLATGKSEMPQDECNRVKLFRKSLTRRLIGCGAMKFNSSNPRAAALDNPSNVWQDSHVCNLFWRQMMAITAHLAELAEKHRALEERIDQVVARPGSDDIEIRRLKQEKLKLKDEIERLRRETRH